MSSFIANFRHTFFQPIVTRLDAAHAPGTTLIDLAEYLNPLKLSTAIAEGADRCESRFTSSVGRCTHDALGKYVMATEHEARELGSDWVSACEAMLKTASSSTIARLGSHEAEIGKLIVSNLLGEHVLSLPSRFLGQVLGALSGIAFEEAILANKIYQIDHRYEFFISELRPRFDHTIVPAIKADAEYNC